VGFLRLATVGPPLCCSAARKKPTHTFCTRKSQQRLIARRFSRYGNTHLKYISQRPDRVHITQGRIGSCEPGRFSHAVAMGSKVDALFRAACRKLSLRHDEVGKVATTLEVNRMLLSIIQSVPLASRTRDKRTLQQIQPDSRFHHAPSLFSNGSSQPFSGDPTCDRFGETSTPARQLWLNAANIMARENDDAGPTLLAISIFVLVLVLTTTALRITVRANRRALGGDDYTIAAASLLTIGRVTCQIISVPHGNGRHREFLSIEDYQYVNFLTWLTQLFLFPILCLLKISVCLLVLRIKSTKRLRYCLWALIVLLILTTLLPDIVLLAQCDPVSAYWTSQQDKCWTPNVRIYSIYLQTCMFAIDAFIPQARADNLAQPSPYSPTWSARCFLSPWSGT
jgi:hypothetical protein